MYVTYCGLETYSMRVGAHHPSQSPKCRRLVARRVMGGKRETRNKHPDSPRFITLAVNSLMHCGSHPFPDMIVSNRIEEMNSQVLQRGKMMENFFWHRRQFVEAQVTVEVPPTKPNMGSKVDRREGVAHVWKGMRARESRSIAQTLKVR